MDSWRTNAQYVTVGVETVLAPSSYVEIPIPPTDPAVCLSIGKRSHIFAHFVILRPSGRVIVGDRCQLGSSQVICAQEITIGDDVIMAWGCTIMDSDNHSLDWNYRQYDVERCRNDYLNTAGKNIAKSHDWDHVKKARISIGDKVWIGFNVIILKGVTIGEGAVIGAGSVVTRDVPSWHVVVGNPARIVKKIEK